MKIGVISNSDLCVPLLHYLKQVQAQVVCYIGLHNREVNIGKVIMFCNTNAIPVTIESEPGDLYGWLQKNEPDYSFIFCYTALIKLELLGKYKDSIFNIHPGKLPGYRGPNPVFWQLKNGEKTLGLTIHLLGSKYDTGDIVWSKEINSEPHCNYGVAHAILANMLIEGVHFVLNSDKARLLAAKQVQPPTGGHYYKKPALEDVLINWAAMGATGVVNLVRACNPWNKGALTICNGTEVRITDADVIEEVSAAAAGTITAVGDLVKVACADKTTIGIYSLCINEIIVPARFAGKFGFAAGLSFG